MTKLPILTLRIRFKVNFYDKIKENIPIFVIKDIIKDIIVFACPFVC